MHNIDGIDYYNIQEAAKYLDLTEGRVRQLISEGFVDRLKMGNTSYLTVESVHRYKETRTNAGWPKGKLRKQQSDA
jgi:excisionase family DNA binding protein